MTTIILAAGYGTRLYPLTLDKPKALLEVGGVTILDRLIRKIELLEGCDRVFVVTNDKFSGSFTHWQTSSAYSVAIEVMNDETTTNKNRLGAIGDINFVLRKKNIHDDLLIAGSDNLFDLDLREFVKFAQNRAPYSSIALVDIKDRARAKKYGICSVDKESMVTDFEEKPTHPKSALAASALYYIPKVKLPKVFEYMESNLSKDAPGNLMKWLAKEDRVFGYVMKGSWYDIGDIKSLEKADKEFRLKEEKTK